MNKHINHLEDLIFLQGDRGVETINGILNRGWCTGADVSRKWDGAPSIFIGVDPSDNHFFVAKKSIFNKTPKVYKSVSDIRDDGLDEALTSKLTIAYSNLVNLRDQLNGRILQGDLLYTHKMLNPYLIDDDNVSVAFQPNTIAYAIRSDSDSFNKLLTHSQLGVVWHTEYVIGSSGQLNDLIEKVNSPDTSDLKADFVWMFDARIDVEEMQTSYPVYDGQMETLLWYLRNNPEVGKVFVTFINHCVKNDRQFPGTDGPIHKAIQFCRWYMDLTEKEVLKRKTVKGKWNYLHKRRDVEAGVMCMGVDNLAMLFELHQQITQHKEAIIDTLDCYGDIDTYLINTDGTARHTTHEGYVLRSPTGTTVKLVNRYEFSRANFSSSVVKGWESDKRELNAA